MLRHSLLLGAAMMVAAAAADAQQRGQTRDDLLDVLTRHIQICAELTESQSRLACYDRLQTQVGGVQPQTTPLAPPPLATPGGGVATLGGNAPPSYSDPDRAFDPRNATSSYRPPEAMMPKPQPPVRRTGPRPVPTYSTPQPLVTLAANNLTYGEARYWQVTISITSNTPRTLETQVQCTFLNAGQPASDAYFGPTSIAPGEQITTELIGPPTTAYVDSTNCRVLRP